MFKYKCYLRYYDGKFKSDIGIVNAKTIRECVNKICCCDICGYFMDINKDELMNMMKGYSYDKTYEICIGEYSDGCYLYIKRV